MRIVNLQWEYNITCNGNTMYLTWEYNIRHNGNRIFTMGI